MQARSTGIAPIWRAESEQASGCSGDSDRAREDVCREVIIKSLKSKNWKIWPLFSKFSQNSRRSTETMKYYPTSFFLTCNNMSLKKFIRITRNPFQTEKKQIRFVYISEINRNSDEHNIDKYIAEKVPFFYREAKRISDSFSNEFFLTAIYEALCRLPDSKSFQESHFGEIISGLFAEDVIGLKKIYSKLSLLTAENANAYKMDLVLYNPNSDPVELFFCEVKCSVQNSPELKPVNHDKSIYASMFNSMNNYHKEDFDFDFAAAKDHIDKLPQDEQKKLKTAFLPYADNKIVKFLGFAVIDSSTYNSEEISVLATRKNDKEFDIDVICLDELPQVVQNVYSKLVNLRDQCTP